MRPIKIRRNKKRASKRRQRWLLRLIAYFHRHPEPEPVPGMWFGETR